MFERISKEQEQAILSDILERSGVKYEPGSQMWNATFDQMASDYDYDVEEFKKRLIKADLAWNKIMGMKWGRD
jgi:hypothetical protein